MPNQVFLANPMKRRHLPRSRGRPFWSIAVPKRTQQAQANTIPMVQSHDGHNDEKELTVVSSSTSDAHHAAEPFKVHVLEQLTPTLRKFTLHGKVAVVTGGARGLGRNMAQALVEAGARGIAIFDIQHDVGEQAAKELSTQSGADVRYYNVDVRHAQTVSAAFDHVFLHFGRVDILINSAGIADSNLPAETYPVDKFRRQIDINLTGSFLVAQACAERMIETKNGGSMIFIASMSGTIVNYPQEQCCYNASKAGVVQLVKSLAAEWAKHGIRVNAISPGYMDTALNRVPALEAQKKIWINSTPQKRLGHVDELNGLAVYLASEASTYMTGSNLLIDGGYTLW